MIDFRGQWGGQYASPRRVVSGVGTVLSTSKRMDDGDFDLSESCLGAQSIVEGPSGGYLSRDPSKHGQSRFNPLKLVKQPVCL